MTRRSWIKKSLPKLFLSLTLASPYVARAESETRSSSHQVKRTLKYVEGRCLGNVPRSERVIGKAVQPADSSRARELIAEADPVAQEGLEGKGIEGKNPRDFLPMFPLHPETFVPETEQTPTTPQQESEKESTPKKSIGTDRSIPQSPQMRDRDDVQQDTSSGRQNLAPFWEEELPPQKEERSPSLPPLFSDETEPFVEPSQEKPSPSFSEEESEEPSSMEQAPSPETSPSEGEQVLEEQVKPLQQQFLINFSDVAITEYIRFISRISGKNFIFSNQDLNFNVTVVSEEAVTIDELMALLLQELRIHNLELMEEGDSLIIHSNPSVNSPPTVIPRPPGESIPENVQLLTRVFNLSSFDTGKAANIIRPLLSSHSIIEPIPESGYLIVTDLKVNIDRIAELLEQLDSPMSGLAVGQYRSTQILAEALQILGERILVPLAEGKEIRFIPLADTNTLFIISTPVMVNRAVDFFESLDREIGANGRGSRRRLIGEELLSGDRMQTEEGLESSESELLTEEEQRLREQQLGNQRRDSDQGSGGFLGAPGSGLGEPYGRDLGLLNSLLPSGHIENTEFEIFKLENRKGDQIQEALQLIGDSMIETQSAMGEESSNKNSDLLNAISSVQWIESSNALVFTGTPSANRKLKNLIKELDVPNQQVLIELLLLDTTITNTYNFGVNWGTRFGDTNSAGSQAFLSTNSPLLTALNGIDTTDSSTVLNAATLATTQGFNLGVIGRTISFNGLSFSNLGALISALHSNTDSEVVLNQKLVVEENSEAEIFVGLNVPFRSQSIVSEFSNFVTDNVEYRDVGARMKVTPIINKNGIITLEIEQELSTISNAVAAQLVNNISFDQSTTAAITTKKSNSSSTVFVPDGFFVIMSGTIQDEDEKTRTQIPCLGGLPVLGGAFSEKNNRGTKRSLLMFIRPTLLNTKEDILRETKRQQDIFDQKSENYNMWRYEIDEALDFLNISDPRCCF